MYVPYDNGFFKNAEGHDRYVYPEGLVRVTGGAGGEAILIIGSEKVAMHDLGMACFSDKLISNIHEVLDPMGRTLDYILMSHTHYDHIGALPYVIKEFPDVVVCGSIIADKVFKSETAIGVMEKLGKEAKELYGVKDVEITARGNRLDVALSEGDTIDLGDMIVTAYEAKGHTDCSMAYVVEKKDGTKILFTNESVGSFERPGSISSSPLKSFEDSYETAEKLKSLNCDYLVLMHYGMADPKTKETYFDDYIATAKEEQAFIKDLISKGLTDEEIFAEHKKKYWTDERDVNQPYGAYKTNTEVIIRKQRGYYA